MASVLVLTACGDEQDEGSAPVSEDPGPIHVHGLGVNPADRALYIATHTGLFRLGPGDTEATRVGDRWQDTMGFTVMGPDRFLGSGHPDGRDDLPPFLGLIESRDAGESWQPVSLLGDSDFHVLEAREERVYGFGSDWETRKPQFLVSADGGETWERRKFPSPFVSLALHPNDPERLVASGASALYASGDGGKNWQQLGPDPGLVAWSSDAALVMVAADGTVRASADGGETWSEGGSVDGEPAAFEADSDGLYVALHDGTVMHSVDGGESWEVRSSP